MTRHNGGPMGDHREVLHGNHLIPREPIGSEGELPLPSAHTTVRTGPYTAVQVLRCRARS